MEPNSRRERTVLGWALGVSLAALLLDQWTKIVVERQFVLGESRPVWEPFFSLTFVRNEGAAWSILSGHGWFLLLVAGVVTLGVIWYFRRLAEGYAERYFALLLVLGGPEVKRRTPAPPSFPTAAAGSRGRKARLRCRSRYRPH